MQFSIALYFAIISLYSLIFIQKSVMFNLTILDHNVFSTSPGDDVDYYDDPLGRCGYLYTGFRARIAAAKCSDQKKYLCANIAGRESFLLYSG